MPLKNDVPNVSMLINLVIKNCINLIVFCNWIRGIKKGLDPGSGIAVSFFQAENRIRSQKFGSDRILIRNTA
jgi:hypothetical protein